MAQYYTADGYPYWLDEGEPASAADGTALATVAPVVDDDAFTAAARKLYRGVFSPAREDRAPKIIDLLAGGNPEVERFQTWPEKMVRSATTLPYDAMMGRVPETEAVMQPNALATFLGADPQSTWSVPAHESMIGRVQDLAGLAIGGPLTAPRGGATLRSGLERPDIGGGVMVSELMKPHPDNPTLSVRGFDEALKLGREYNERAKELGGIPRHQLDRDPKIQEISQRIESNRQQSAQDIAAWAQADATRRQQFAPVFYSAVEHAVSNARQQQATPDQWLGFLRNQPGVKAEELQWMGLDDWLKSQKGPVRKEQIDEFVRNNKVEIKMIQKRGEEVDSEGALGETADSILSSFTTRTRFQAEPSASEANGLFNIVDQRGTVFGAANTKEQAARAARELQKEFDDAIKNENHDVLYDLSSQAADYTLREQSVLAGQRGDPSAPVKYSEYQLPGGENYRELLLTLPYNKKGIQPREGETLVDALERGHAEHPAPYTTSHWDEPNVLAHVRVNDRHLGGQPVKLTAQERANYDKWSWLDYEERKKLGVQKEYERILDRTLDDGSDAGVGGFNEGGARTLFLEEVQSDWHQAGRKGGYGSKREPTAEEIETRAAQFYNNMHRNEPGWQALDKQTQQQYLREAREDLMRREGTVPDAPFKTTWPDLVLKRMVREAAENGYDQIAWTPGEVQAARYDLSKQIKNLHWSRYPDGSYGLSGETTRGGQHQFGSQIPEAKLEDFVGKDVAKKIVDQSTAEQKRLGNPQFSVTGILEGADLKVGGEGMKAFYDKMLVDKANAIGKKFGAKVERQPLGAEYQIYEPRTPYSLGPAKMGTDNPLKVGDYAGVYFEGPNGIKSFTHNLDKKVAEERLKELNETTNTYTVDDGGAGHPLPGKGFKTRAEAETWVKDNTPSAWVMKITPKMREAAVGKGFPLFSAGLPFQFERVDHDPFSAAAAYQSPLYRTEPVDHDPFGVLPYDPNRT